jgi:hypothetical protein
MSVGKAISDLVREAPARRGRWEYRNGVPQFPKCPGGEVVTLEFVNALRDEE